MNVIFILQPPRYTFKKTSLLLVYVTDDSKENEEIKYYNTLATEEGIMKIDEDDDYIFTLKLT